MNTRTFTLCLLTIHSFILQSYAQDWQQLSGPYGATADALSKTSDGKLFLCTWSGLYRSVLGSPWEKVFGENADIFIDADDKIYITQRDKLYISVDAGETFTKQSDLPSATCRVRKLSNGKLVLFAVWSPSSLLFISEDDGLTWNEQYTFPAHYILPQQMDVYNDRIFVGTPSHDGLLVSDNEGSTFVQKNSGASARSVNTIIKTPAGALLRQSNDRLYKSVNGGDSWSSIPSPHDGLLNGHLATNGNDELLFFDYGEGKTYKLNQSGTEWEVTNPEFPFKSHSINATVTLGNDIYVLFSLLGVFRTAGDGAVAQEINEGILPMSPVRVEVYGDTGIVAASSHGISRYSRGSWITTRNTVNGERLSGWDLIPLDGDRLFMDPAFYSDDNGATWKSTSLGLEYSRTAMGPGQRLYNYDIQDTDQPRLYVSTDLGHSWQEKIISDLPVLGYRERPLAADGKYVYLTGSRGQDYEIWKIDPDALTAELIYGTTGWIDQILVKDGSIYMEEDNKLYRSDDDAVTWKHLPIPSGAVDIGFEFLGNTLWIGSLTGGIQYSSDKGNTWSSLNYPTDDYNVRPTSFAADKDGYVYAGVMNVGVIKSRFPVLAPGHSGNHKPIAHNVVKHGKEDEVVEFTTEDFLTRYSDEDGDPLKEIMIVTLPGEGEGILKLDGTPVVATQVISVDDLDKLTFINESDLFGDYEFTFKVSDGNTFSETPASAILHISSVNDPPIFSVRTTLSVYENFAGIYSLTPLRKTIPFEENEAITYSLQPSATGIVAIDFNSETGEIKLTSIPDMNGFLELELKASETGDVNSTYTQNISVEVHSVNSPPTISPIADVEVESVIETVNFAINDVDNPPSTLEVTASSTNPLLVNEADFIFSGTGVQRSLSFVVARFAGESDITIFVSDGVDVAQQTFKVISSLVTSIGEVPFGAARLYPNPVNDIINVSLPGLTPPHQVSLSDLTGRAVATSVESGNSFQLQVKDFPEGVYLLKVVDQRKRIATMRVVRKQ